MLMSNSVLKSVFHYFIDGDFNEALASVCVNYNRWSLTLCVLNVSIFQYLTLSHAPDAEEGFKGLSELGIDACGLKTIDNLLPSWTYGEITTLQDWEKW